MLQPKRAVQQGIVLLGGCQAEVDPDPPQTVERLKLRLGHVARIVPNQAASQCRQICHQTGAQDNRKCEQISRTDFVPICAGGGLYGLGGPFAHWSDSTTQADADKKNERAFRNQIPAPQYNHKS
jgi:hypothetical protein